MAKSECGSDRRRSRVGSGLTIAALACGLGAIGVRSRAIGQVDRGPPSRPDIVATFSDGPVTINVDGHVANTHVVTGRVSLSTDNAQCVATTSHDCSYTLNELRIRAAGFSLSDHNFDYVQIGSAQAQANEISVASGTLPIRPDTPFWITGVFDGDEFGIFAPAHDGTSIDIADLVITPALDHLQLFATLVGEFDGKPVTVTLSTTADEPFVNRPPFIAPTNPAHVMTSCVASVDVDPHLVDTDGDVEATWVDLHGAAIGVASAPIMLPAGEFDLRVVSEDSHGGRASSTTHVTVEQDGSVPTVAGSGVVSFELPRGVDAARAGIVSETDIDLQPRATVMDGSTPAEIAALGSISLGTSSIVGETWAGDNITLGNGAHVAGDVHVGGTLHLGGGTVDGATLHDGPYTPTTALTFSVPVSSGGASVSGTGIPLPEGTYGAVTVGPHDQLVLGAGLYAFESLDVSPNADVLVTGSPVVVSVTGAIGWHGTMTTPDGAPALLLVALGTGTLQLHSRFAGWIVAPAMDVVVLPSDDPHVGSIFAHDVTVQPGAEIVHVAFEWSTFDAQRAACAITPVVHCVRPSPGGGFDAVFGYQSLLPHMGAIVAPGPFNRISPALPTTSDHQVFIAGGRERAFEVHFDTQVTWVLGAREATATGGSTPCR